MENKVFDYDKDWKKVTDKMTYIDGQEARDKALAAFLFAHVRL